MILLPGAELFPSVAYPSLFHQSMPPISSLTLKPSLVRFKAPFVEALQPMPSQYVTYKTSLQSLLVVSTVMSRCGKLMAPGICSRSSPRYAPRQENRRRISYARGSAHGSERSHNCLPNWNGSTKVFKLFIFPPQSTPRSPLQSSEGCRRGVSVPPRIGEQPRS